MPDIDEVLAEEMEVLESIYPDELTKISEREIELLVEPEEPVSEAGDLKLSLHVTFPDGYPDLYPEVSIKAIVGDIDDDEESSLLQDLTAVGTDSLGAAMTFTLVSHLREALTGLLTARARKIKQAATEKERLEIEAEEARTRGNPVTTSSFAAWNAKFIRETKRLQELKEDEKLKGMAPKEREEWKKATTRLTGKQLFERDRTLATSDTSLLEEGTVSVDISQYERHDLAEEQEDTGIVTFSDSD